MTAALQTHGVTRRFGGLTAVDDVTMTVRRSHITGLIGPNGAGKSTLFNLMTGVLDVSAGRIEIDGVDVTGEPPAAIAHRGVGRTFQSPRGFPSLTVGENVELALADRRDSVWGAVVLPDRNRARRRQLVAESLARVGLEARIDDDYRRLSGGEARMVEIARQLVRQPQLLMLDEPTAGVSPNLQHRLEELLRSLRDEGTTILLVEHNLGFLMRLSDEIHVLALGHLLASGTPAEIASNEDVIGAYLGDEWRHHAAQG